jgi:hypothetical protein
LNQKANQNKHDNEVAYKAFIQSFTPTQIRLANNARRLLKKKTQKAWPLLVDERQPARPNSVFVYFMKSRHASGDMKGIPVAEALPLIAKEYQALSPSEKKVTSPRKCK